MNEIGQLLGNGLVLGVVYALMAAGLTLVFGYMEVVNFAHGHFYMIGAYLTYTFSSMMDLPFGVALLGTAVGAVIFGLVVDRLILRPLRRHTGIEVPMLAMIGLAIMLPNLAIAFWGPIPKTVDSPVSGATVDLGIMQITPQAMFVTVAAAVFILAAHLWMTRTKVGLTMRGTFQDSTASWLMGVNVSRVYGMTFAFGALLAAVAGALIATVFQISPTMGDLATGKSFVVVILGGLGSFPGAIAGGLLLGLVESFGAGYISAGYKDTFGLFALLLALLLMPQGLFGKVRTVQE